MTETKNQLDESVIESSTLLATKIYTRGRTERLKDALSTMDERWINNGNFCTQTVRDLVSSLRIALNEIKSLKTEIYNENWRHMNAEADLKRQLKLVTSQRDSWIACAKKHGYSNTSNTSA